MDLSIVHEVAKSQTQLSNFHVHFPSYSTNEQYTDEMVR